MSKALDLRGRFLDHTELVQVDAGYLLDSTGSLILDQDPFHQERCPFGGPYSEILAVLTSDLLVPFPSDPWDH